MTGKFALAILATLVVAGCRSTPDEPVAAGAASPPPAANGAPAAFHPKPDGSQLDDDQKATIAAEQAAR